MVSQSKEGIPDGASSGQTDGEATETKANVAPLAKSARAQKADEKFYSAVANSSAQIQSTRASEPRKMRECFFSAVGTLSVARKKSFGHLLRGESTRTLDDVFKRRVEEAKGGAVRQRVVRAPRLELGQNEFSAPVHPKSKEERNFIYDVSGRSLFFEKLGARETETLVDAYERYVAPKGSEIIRQGDIGDYFYIIQSGTVKHFVDGTHVGTGKEGDFFGELALLYNSPRQATCIAEAECILWRVHQSTFKKIIFTYQMKDDAEMKKFLKKVDFLEALSDGSLTKIAYVLTTKTYEEGETVMQVKKGETVNTFFLVKDGKLVAKNVVIGGQKLDDDIEFGPSEHFGGPYMGFDQSVTGTVVAQERSTVFSMHKDVFTKVIGDVEHLVRKGLDKKLLGTVQFKNKPKLHHSLVSSLSGLFVNMSHQKNHVFYTEGTVTNPTLFFIRSGKVSVSNTNGTTKLLSKPGYFGEENLDYFNLGDPVIAENTAEVIEDCVVGVLSGRVASSVIGSQGRKAGIKFDDLQKHDVLGAGTFGQVWLVTRKGTKETYALKSQLKRQLIEEDQVEGAIREKDIMAKMDSEFIIKLIDSYKDRKYVYMLLKLYQGGELWSLMHNDDGKLLPESAVKFYTASVLEGLSYMHRRLIVYRDLKPENVMINDDGYTVIVDLGFAKFVPEQTYTFCGTPVYIAPEIILQRGHNKSADHWSWAVMVYEMICGITPFYDRNIDEMTLYKRIASAKYIFPSGEFVSRDAKDLIERLLVVVPVDRLGSFAGADRNIQKHPWFQEINFEKLANKEMTPPWMPDIVDPQDISNLNEPDELDSKIQEGAPLTLREQKLFKDF